MTPERARAVHEAQKEFPFWGNYRRFMTPDEIDFVEEKFRTAESGNVTFASIVREIAKEGQ